jgi:hypothetical protein
MGGYSLEEAFDLWEKFCQDHNQKAFVKDQ